MASSGTGATEPFRVIEGAWLASSDWLNLPQSIRARAPEDRSRSCRVRVNREDVVKAAGRRRRQPAYDFWSVLNGKPPPVPNREADPNSGLMTLFDAHACFQGVRRPIAEDADGDRFVAYVLKPSHFFVYDARPPLVMCLKRVVDADLVFVAYVRLDEPMHTNAVKGVLTHWHFVEADSRDNRLPDDFDHRYVKQLW